MDFMKRFYITGVSGTGKSTVAEELKKRGIYTIDIDSIKGLSKWINKDTNKVSHQRPDIDKEFFKKNKNVCDREKLIEMMGNEEIVVVLGLRDNQNEILDLFDKIFLFSCSEDILMKRILNRTENDFGKHPLEQKMIIDSYKKYEKKMLEKGAILVNADKPLEEVVEEVIKNIKN